MPLFAHMIGLGEPAAKLGIDFIGCGQPENRHMIPGRDCLNPAKTRMLESACQHEVIIQPICARCHLGKRHAHLESDPRLLRKNTDRAERSQRRRYLVEERFDFRPLALEMMFQIISTAGV